MSRNRVSRRDFVKTAGVAATAAYFVPRTAWGANDKIYVGGIGVGGKGAVDIQGAADAGGTIVALCDVDDKRKRREVSGNFPDAAFYYDYREMLEKEGDRLDAVTISTPDHVHCPATVMAMRLGLHVYTQKPLTRTIGEARLMTKVAAETGVATQMGNQAHAGDPIRRAVELVRAGMIGKVSEAHVWTNRPIWPQGMTERPPAMPVPETLKWDLWCGPGAFRPYNEAYVPFKWRGWWDYGCGALGDMGCHIMDMPFWSLDLTAPTSVTATSTGCSEVAAPTASTVTYRFDPTDYCTDLKYVWYDGNRYPPGEPALPDSVVEGIGMTPEQVSRSFECVLVGEKGKFFFNRGNMNWKTSVEGLLEEYASTPESIPRTGGAYDEWLRMAEGGPTALSNFAVSGPFTETVLLGNLAVRLEGELEWDAENLKVKGRPEADELIHAKYRQGWEI